MNTGNYIRYTNKAARHWTNAITEYARSRSYQKHNYQNGSALKHHCESAHDGQFDTKCPACQEMKAKGAK